MTRSLVLGLGILSLCCGQSVPRGYTIPQFDFSSDSNRQVIVDREPGQYLGHPTTVLLEDGKTMLCAYPKGHGKGPLVLKRSTDGGLTWSPRLPVPENWATSLETPTIHRTIDSAGKRRLIVFSGLYPIRSSVSEDDGRTWTPLAPIGDFGGIVAMADVVRLKNGSYMAVFHDDGRYFSANPPPHPTAPVFTVYKTISKNGGLTWNAPIAIARHPLAHLCEPGIIRSPDGRQLAMLLRENSRKFNSFVAFSNDEGKTWTDPRELPGALTGDRHQGKYLKDGRLFLSFRDTTLESRTRGDWVAWVGSYNDLVQGREGQFRMRLMKNHKAADCAYPGVEVLPDGTVVATTYGHWTEGEPPFVVSVRLVPGDFDMLKKFQTTTVFWQQFEVAEAIVAAKDPSVLPKLEPWLTHQDWHLRGNAAFIFGRLGDPRGFDVITAILRDHSERPEAQGTPGGKWSLQGQIQADRYYAAHLLGDLKDPRAVPVLVALLNDPVVNYIVPWSLGHIGDRSAVQPLIGLLRDRNPSMRVLAIYALVELKAQEALPALRVLLNDRERCNFDKMESVAEAASAAIAKLQPH
ncbi:MAG: HEAT repeat domain-containing protein [Bryobacteraceae bacterium]